MKISRTATGLLAVAMLAFVASDVMAQRGGGRDGGDQREGGGQRGGPGGQRGGPGGGRGGPGGGFGGGFGGTQDMTFALLRVEAIQEDIELMPDQEDALKKLNERGEQRERPDFDFRNASEEERTAFFEKMRAQRDEANKKRKEQLEEVLLPEQMDRLHQISIQIQGVGALSNEEVAKELKITDAQKKELDEARSSTSMRSEEARAKLREIMTEAGDDDEKRREAFAKWRKEGEDKVLAVLTSAQRKQFDEMKGKEFKMPEGGVRALFGGGRGGPGGGRGGPGGGRGGFGGGDRGGPGGDRGGDGGGRERRRPAAEE